MWRCAGRVEKNGTCKARTVKQSEIDEKMVKNKFCEIIILEEEIVLLVQQ